MFRSAVPRREWVEVWFDGEKLLIPPGKNLAASLLAAGKNVFGMDQAGRPRRPFCMIGHCFGCWIVEDGKTVQACVRTVQASIRLEVRKER